jgi:hypothetical protein
MRDNQGRRVLPFGGLTKADVPVEKVLDGAKEAKLETVFVLGFDAEGELYAAASVAAAGEFMVAYEQWKAKLYAGEEPWAGVD